jgi:hypothetical protein
MVERRRGVLWALWRKDGPAPRHQSGADDEQGHGDEHQEDAPQRLLLLLVRRPELHLPFLRAETQSEALSRGSKGVDENREKIVRLMSIPILHRL